MIICLNKKSKSGLNNYKSVDTCDSNIEEKDKLNKEEKHKSLDMKV